MYNLWNLSYTNRKRTTILSLIFSYIILCFDIIMNILLVPIYISNIGFHLYGIWLATGGLVAMLSFFDLGISGFLTQRVAKEYGQNNYNNISNYFFTGLILHFIFMVLFAILGITLSYFLSNIYSLSYYETILISKAFKLTLFGTIFTLLNNSIDGTACSLHKPIFVKTTQIFANIICLITILYTIKRGYSVLSIGYGLLIRGIFPFIFNLIYIIILFAKNKILTFKKDKNILYEYYNLAPSILVSKFGNAVTGNIEPTLIATFLNPEIVVFYSVTKSAANMGKTIIDRIGGSIYPTLAHLKATTDEIYFVNKFKELINIIFLITITIFSAYFILNKYFISFWVNKESYLGDIFCLSISMGYCVWQMSSITSYFLGAIGDIRYTSYVIFVESMTKLLLLYLSIKFFGINGLPITLLIVSFIFTLIYLLRLKNKHSIAFEFKKFDIFYFIKFVCFILFVYSINILISEIIKNSALVLLYNSLIFGLFYYFFFYNKINIIIKTLKF